MSKTSMIEMKGRVLPRRLSQQLEYAVVKNRRGVYLLKTSHNLIKAAVSLTQNMNFSIRFQARMQRQKKPVRLAVHSWSVLFTPALPSIQEEIEL